MVLAASVQLMQTMQLNDANKGRNKPFFEDFFPIFYWRR